MTCMANQDKSDGPQGHNLDKLESDSDEYQEVSAIAATSSQQVSSSSAKSMKPNKKSFKTVGKSNTLPTRAQISRLVRVI